MENVKLPIYYELEDQVIVGNAKMPVDHINHREIVWEGYRYFCGWSSAKPNAHWIVYERKVEDDG